jgi:protein-disulfide isomerase
MQTPAALMTAVAFVAAAAAAIVLFPGGEVAASSAVSASAETEQGLPPAAPPPQSAIQQLEEFLQQQPRVSVPAGGGSGAAVVIVKFNDYQCPPCGLTFREYKPVLAKLQKEFPGQIAFITKDFPLDPECNSLGGSHTAACEAAAAVRLAREKGQADTMEDWLFANQPTLSPERVKEGLSAVAGISDFDARYPKTLELVRADIGQGIQLGVRGTPTFFMNGIRLPNLRGEFFEAAVRWELRRVAK